MEITIFNGKYIFKWLNFHCHGSVFGGVANFQVEWGLQEVFMQTSHSLSSLCLSQRI